MEVPKSGSGTSRVLQTNSPTEIFRKAYYHDPWDAARFPWKAHDRELNITFGPVD